MREIKFRAWCKPDRKMYPVWDIHFHSETGRMYSIFIEASPYSTRRSDFELMQFTGWHDHFAKEVYESDIVKIDTYHGVVVWDAINDGWRIRIGNTYNLRNNEMVIVGNIYENHELLEQVSYA